MQGTQFLITVQEGICCLFWFGCFVCLFQQGQVSVGGIIQFVLIREGEKIPLASVTDRFFFAVMLHVFP